MTEPGQDTDSRDAADLALRRAYEIRSQQLVEARGTLAEAFTALTTELDARRAEVRELARQLEEARRGAEDGRRRDHELGVELQRSRADLEVLRGMKAVRFSGWLRVLVRRILGRAR